MRASSMPSSFGPADDTAATRGTGTPSPNAFNETNASCSAGTVSWRSS